MGGRRAEAMEKSGLLQKQDATITRTNTYSFYEN
jgi:hypothetical protein